MDDQVIRVKRANDCPALLKSFRWSGEERRGGRARRGENGRIQHGEPVDEVFIMAPLPGTAISVFIHTQSQRRGSGRFARGVAQEQLDSFTTSTGSGLREGSFKDLTTCSIALANALFIDPRPREEEPSGSPIAANRAIDTSSRPEIRVTLLTIRSSDSHDRHVRHMRVETNGLYDK